MIIVAAIVSLKVFTLILRESRQMPFKIAVYMKMDNG